MINDFNRLAVVAVAAAGIFTAAPGRVEPYPSAPRMQSAKAPAATDTWKFRHAGFVVKDIDKACAVYESIGFVKTMPPTERIWNSRQYEIFGQPLSPSTAVRFKEAFFSRAKMVLHFLQPLEGKDSQRGFLDTHGEGISDLCFAVDDLEREQAKLVARGFPVIQSVRGPDGALIETWHDTRKIGNVVISLTRGSGSRGTADAGAGAWMFEKYDHVAFVVRDMEKAAKHFQSIGMTVVSEDSSTWGGEAMKYRGKTLAPTPLKLYILLKGGIAVELFWVQEGENLWSDYLKMHGEGVHHVHFSVKDLDGETGKMIEKGFPTTFTITMPGPRLVESFFEPYGNVSIGLYRMNGLSVRFKGLPEP